MAGWLEDLWGKASELWGKASERVEEAQEEKGDPGLQEAQEQREKAADDSLRQVEARQKREVEEKLKSRRAERRVRILEGRGVYSRENLQELAGPEAPEGFGGEVPGEQWRKEAADESLRDVTRRQGQPQAGLPPRPPEGEGPGARDDRTNEQILEALEAIRGLLEESKEILQEIKEKQPAGATWGP